MSKWSDPNTLTNFVIAVTGLVTAVGGIVVGYKAHSKIKNDIKPQLAETQQELQEVKDGATNP